MPLSRSDIYGGIPARGDVAAPPGHDAVIVLPSEAYEIEYIHCAFSLGVLDFDDPANQVRSFFSRLVIIEQALTRDLSNGGAFFNDALTNPLPSDLGTVIFDTFFHDFRKGPFQFYPPRSNSGDQPIGAWRSESGRPLSVIAFNPTCYVNGAVHSDMFTSFLHVKYSPYASNVGIGLAGLVERTPK